MHSFCSVILYLTLNVSNYLNGFQAVIPMSFQVSDKRETQKTHQ